jgi:predicted transcriptional regulator
MPRPKGLPERQLTELELELMQEIWTLGKCTVRDVRDAFRKKLAYTTIATVMKVLEQKGFLSIQKHDKAHVYEPTLSREAYARGALKHVAERLYRGRAAPMVAQLLDESELTHAELKHLRELLKSKLAAQ